MSDDIVMPADIQALRTLKAARDVAEALEGARKRLRAGGLPPRSKQRLREDMLGAAERLCNLIDLLLSWRTRVSAQVREGMEEAVAELRGKFLGVGLRLVGDRAERMIVRAAPVLAGDEPLPVSLPDRFSGWLADLHVIVHGLGGVDALPPEVSERLRRAEEAEAELRRRLAAADPFPAL